MHVIIPAYMPDEKLVALVDRLKAETDYNIIVVNDGSAPECDGVFAQIADRVTLLIHEVNMGKGRAMKTAFSYVCENFPGDTGVVIADADGQHLVKDIVRVAELLEAKPDRIIIGSRRFTGKVPFRSRCGNAVTRAVFAIASGVKVYDTQTGLRAIPTRYLPEFIKLRGERYEYEMNMLLRAAEIGIAMEETTIDTVYIGENESSHFHPIRDSFKIYAVIFKFIFSSLLCFAIDYGAFVLLALATGHLFTQNISNLISTAAARIISSFCNYFINKKAVFKSGGACGHSVLKYYSAVIVVFGIHYGLLTLMTDAFCWNKFLSQIVAMIITYPISYYLQRMFVFKTRTGRS